MASAVWPTWSWTTSNGSPRSAAASISAERAGDVVGLELGLLDLVRVRLLEQRDDLRVGLEPGRREQRHVVPVRGQAGAQQAHDLLDAAVGGRRARGSRAGPAWRPAAGRRRVLRSTRVTSIARRPGDLGRVLPDLRATRRAERCMHPVRTGTHAAMTIEAHATAAGAGHPPQEAEPPPGALVNLAETTVIKEENVFVVSRRDGSLPVGARPPARALPRRLPLPLRPRAVRQPRAAAAAGRLRRAGHRVRPRADQPGAAAARRAHPPAAEPPAAARAADRGRRRGRGDAARPLLRPRAALPRPRPPARRRLRADAGDPRHPGDRPGRAGGRRAARGRRPLRAARPRRAPPRADRGGRPPRRARRATRPSCGSRSAWRRAARRRSRCATACTRTRRRARGRRAARDASPRRSADAWLAGAHGRGDRRRALQPRAAALAARRADAALAPRRRRLLRRRRALVRDALRPRLADHGDAAARLRPGRWPRRRCACWRA